MPKALDDCIKKLKEKGYSKDKAWPICIEKTGWYPKKGGGWEKRKKNKKKVKK